VSCSLPSFLWTSIRKNGRRKGEIDSSSNNLHFEQAKKLANKAKQNALITTLHAKNDFFNQSA